MESSAREFLSLLVRSRLFDQQRAQAAFARWQGSAPGQSDNSDDWRRWLVDQHLITEYQSALLGRGHTEGHFLGQYRILDRIGRGRMAGVYRASDAKGEQVAIKVLPPSKAKDPVLLARFQREARLSGRLDHPNVVRTKDVGAAEGFNFLVMEFLEGETLDIVLHRRGSLDVQETSNLLEQALSGLQHVHEKNLVHRDVKPANMMLVLEPGLPDAGRPDGSTLKLVDFGLSRATDEAPSSDTQDGQLTVAGALLGTPDYVAPEQARDARSADIRADIYSLGCVGYHLLTGRPPFPDKNSIRQMIRHATETPPALAQVRPETPVFLQKVIERMLAKDPADRFASPAEALKALRSSSRETETLHAAPSRADSSVSTTLLPAVDQVPEGEINFAGADAPTIKQVVFTALPAEITGRTSERADTTSDNPASDEFERQFAVTTGLAVPGNIKQKNSASKKRKQAAQLPGTAAAGLIPPNPELKVPIASGKFYWTTRDTLVFAAGAATVLSALGLGALISWILHGQ